MTSSSFAVRNTRGIVGSSFATRRIVASSNDWMITGVVCSDSGLSRPFFFTDVDEDLDHVDAARWCRAAATSAPDRRRRPAAHEVDHLLKRRDAGVPRTSRRTSCRRRAAGSRPA